MYGVPSKEIGSTRDEEAGEFRLLDVVIMRERGTVNDGRGGSEIVLVHVHDDRL